MHFLHGRVCILCKVANFSLSVNPLLHFSMDPFNGTAACSCGYRGVLHFPLHFLYVTMGNFCLSTACLSTFRS